MEIKEEQKSYEKIFSSQIHTHTYTHRQKSVRKGQKKKILENATQVTLSTKRKCLNLCFFRLYIEGYENQNTAKKTPMGKE